MSLFNLLWIFTTVNGMYLSQLKDSMASFMGLSDMQALTLPLPEPSINDLLETPPLSFVPKKTMWTKSILTTARASLKYTLPIVSIHSSQS
jgi:hypothetical protein